MEGQKITLDENTIRLLNCDDRYYSGMKEINLRSSQVKREAKK